MLEVKTAMLLKLKHQFDETQNINDLDALSKIFLNLTYEKKEFDPNPAINNLMELFKMQGLTKPKEEKPDDETEKDNGTGGLAEPM